MTDDEGADARNPDVHDQVHAIGAQLGYTMPQWRLSLVMKYLYEYYAEDRLVHFSNILLLVSYSVRDILWLRWFAVAAALTNIPYFLSQPDILWPPVLWALVFTTIKRVSHLPSLRRSPNPLATYVGLSSTSAPSWTRGQSFGSRCKAS